MRQSSYSYKVHTQKEQYLEDHNRRSEIGKEGNGEVLLFFFVCFFVCLFFVFVFCFFFFGCSKHKSLGIKPHIAYSMYNDSWIQNTLRQKSNKGKTAHRHTVCRFQHVHTHICRTSYNNEL